MYEDKQGQKGNWEQGWGWGAGTIRVGRPRWVTFFVLYLANFLMRVMYCIT